jgi:regulator of protease activity HflC (stomatin/prohibitin superfamily)
VDTLIGLVAILVALAVLALVVAALFRVVTVHDYERGLRYSSGRFRGLMPAGSHVLFRPLGEIRVLDARPAYLTLEGQDVLLGDGSSVRVTLAARHVLVDPVAAVTGHQDAWHALYLELQLRLREVLVGRTLEQVLADRAQIGPEVRERAASGVAALGLELLSVDVRDLMLAGELRRAFAGVVTARKEGEAALERARGETAALRNLANAGRLLEDNPGLLQLRLLQHVGGTTGNTLMVNVPDGVARGLSRDPNASGRSGAGTPPAGSDAARTRRRAP